MARATIAMLNVTSDFPLIEDLSRPEQRPSESLGYTYGTEECPCCEAICKAFCELPYGVVIGL